MDIIVYCYGTMALMAISDLLGIPG
jgi:hypothetical protein